MFFFWKSINGRFSNRAWTKTWNRGLKVECLLQNRPLIDFQIGHQRNFSFGGFLAHFFFESRLKANFQSGKERKRRQISKTVQRRISNGRSMDFLENKGAHAILRGSYNARESWPTRRHRGVRSDRCSCAERFLFESAETWDVTITRNVDFQYGKWLMWMKSSRGDVYHDRNVFSR